MKNSIPKEAIPDTKVFVIKQLETSYFDPTFHFHQENQLFLVLQGNGTRFVGKGDYRMDLIYLYGAVCQ